ncbi:hypothetical protein KIW84_074370 [Lathyrus oleraceus]|uniref:Uncharacterized protein n=1 Tax=Pisum sativum TaxID=3888 RepID=A0A9D4ZZU3_PEA|nr:hypothetical protein KIW84_074370 [Pisum sativum]
MGISQRKTRGKGLCKKIHARTLEEREEVTFNEDGQPIGPGDKRKFILSVEAQDWVETTVRDAWRRYKHKIKKNHFLKDSNMIERLKNRPPKVLIAQFKSLYDYWSKEAIQQGINEDLENDDINDEIQEDGVDDGFQEDVVGEEFQEEERDLDGEFQDDDIDGEFQEDDVFKNRV